MTKITYIPGEIANAAIDEHGNRKPVTRTHHIFDDAKDKNQAEINAEVDDTFAFHQSEINALNSQNYVTVDSFSSLPATGAVDTVYRVSNWDGTQQDPSVYSEYAWNGEGYVHLSTKTQIGEMFDISAYHATGGELAKYANLSAALGTNGENVPQSIRKGGMSVKFVQSSDNKYVQFRYMLDDATDVSDFTNTDNWSFCGDDMLVENPEYIKAECDAVGHLLFWIKADGSIDWAIGVPKPVKDYVDSCISVILNGNTGTDIDGLNKVIAFLDDFSTSDTLAALLNKKVDKADGRSLIDKDVADRIHYVENPEFVEVCLDKNGRIIYGAQRNGNFIFGAGVPEQIKEYFKEHGGDLIHDIEAFLAGFDGDETLKEYLEENYGKYEEIPEFVEVKLDANGDILWGIKKDGDIVFGCGIPSEIQKALNKITKDIDDNFGDIRGTFRYITNPEYLFACLDAEDKFLYGVTVEGKFRAADLDFDITETAAWINTVFSLLEDPEHRLEATLDGEDKVLSWRDSEGVKHETNLAVEHSLKLSSEAMTAFQQALKDSGFNPDTHKDARDYHVPQYGSFYIKSETFYLTADERYSDKTGIYLIQDWADTNENAMRDKDTGEIHEEGQPVSLSSYYIKSTLVNDGGGHYSKYNDGVEGHDVQLDFYAANRVSKVGNLYYVTSTLVDGQVVPESIEVTQIIDEPQYKAWPVEKDSEHYCLADVNFGHYLTKDNVIIGVKYQGQSTIYKRKRNFRINFYKNKAKAYIPADDDKFGKKDKIKIGELVRLSGFNLKANWNDNTRIKELLLYRAILDVWFNRPHDDRFPWDKEFGYYTGATGFINGFPCELSIGEGFYGLDVFALKKDEKNYMLDGDDDHSGIFVCGSRRDATNWKHSYAADWEDEMMDDMSQETETAIYNFLKFISIMFIGSDNDYYRWHELTYFVDDTPYDFSKVGNKDGKIYLYPEYGGDEITAIYVTSTLVEGAPTEDSISCKFVGLDESGISTMFKAGNNYYRWHDLTYFVGNTSYDYTQVYESNGKICVKSQGSEIIEVTKIYLTSSLVDGAPAETSIEAEYVGPTSITKKMDVQGFIDYFICMQSFAMWDSICRNMILHTRSDKKRFYPYFYDLDLSMNSAYNADIFDIAYDVRGGQRRTNDMTLWASLLDVYWDEIVNRYSELRKGVLSNDYIKSLYHKATDTIPDNDFNRERAKWGNSGDRTTGDALVNEIIKRLNWLDTDYFKI